MRDFGAVFDDAGQLFGRALRGQSRASHEGLVQEALARGTHLSEVFSDLLRKQKVSLQAFALLLERLVLFTQPLDSLLEHGLLFLALEQERVVVSLLFLTQLVLGFALLQLTLKRKDLVNLLVALLLHFLARALQPLDALLVGQLVPQAVRDLVNQLFQFVLLVRHENVVRLHVLVLVLVQHVLQTLLQHSDLLLHALLGRHDVLPDFARLLSRKHLGVRLCSLIDILKVDRGLEISVESIFDLDAGAGCCYGTGILTRKVGRCSSCAHADCNSHSRLPDDI